MPMGEGSPLDVLAAEPDVDPLAQQRGKGEGLGCPPVDALPRLDGLPPIVIDLLDLPVDVELFGNLAHPHSNLLEHGHLHPRGLDPRHLDGGLKTQPNVLKPVKVFSLVGLGRLQRGGHLVVEGVPDRLDLRGGHRPLLEQLRGVLLQSVWSLCDSLVHQRVGESGLISLVVPVLSVTHKVHHNVCLECSAPPGSKLHHAANGLHVISVHVEDRGVQGLGDVRAVGRGPGELWVSGVGHLIVDDDVDRAANGVVRQLGHVVGLVHDSLA
mmetsp:Transcript_3620/g.12701  ORF Transcript_3620/g.12701 Transcript_3620/m.12701 type:complete len:269 (+) Transcript_3620:547-1353(+)